MKKIALKVEKREIFGKKLKKLRKQGVIPANIYGPDFKSASISINLKDFFKTYKIVRETGIVHLELDKQEIPTLIKYVQLHPVNDDILHVDFRKVDLSKKIQTEVPVKVIGVSEAVAQKGGVLLIQSENLLVDALPTDIPSEIEVDISSIKEIGIEIKVSDLVKSNKFEIKSPSDKVIVSVIAHKEESITPETTSAAPEVLTEKPAEGEEVPSAAGTTISEKPAGQEKQKLGAAEKQKPTVPPAKTASPKK